MLDIPKVLKTLRENKKMSMRELAEISGYTAQTIHNRETDKRGGYDSLVDILDALGYELKVVPKRMFEGDIIEFTQALPETMHPDQDADEGFVSEFGRPLKSDETYLIADDKGNLFSSRLYLFDDGKIEGDGYFYENPVAWMEMPKYEGNK